MTGLDADRFLVDQLLRPVVNLYRVTPLAAGESSAGPPVAYVRQKKLAIKEDIRFYADESEQQELFRIKARSIFDIGGAVRRLRRRREARGPRAPVPCLAPPIHVDGPRADDAELMTAQERSLPLAIVRRLIDFVPHGEMIPIPYNFDLSIGGRVVGGMDRKFQLRDRYVLDLSGDHDHAVDRRLAITLAIGLDTLRNR